MCLYVHSFHFSSFQCSFLIRKASGSEAEDVYTWREMPGSQGSSPRHLDWRMVLMVLVLPSRLGVLVPEAAINIYHLEATGAEVEKARLSLLLRLAAQRLAQQALEARGVS